MIYLGGSCSSEQRTLMRTIAQALREEGYEVYCPFELKIMNAWDYTQEDWARLVFERDIMALNEASTFLMITPGRSSTAGTNWEQGYIYGRGTAKVIVVQYTDNDTSLMTFCGSDLFVNTTKENIIRNILRALLVEDPDGSNNKCMTTLT